MRGVPRERLAISVAPASIDLYAEDFGGALDDDPQVVVGIELQPQQDAEARTQRRGEQAGTGGRADEGERLHVHRVGSCRRTLADHDVEFVVFERGVEHLFERGLQAVDFVDEQDLACREGW